MAAEAVQTLDIMWHNMQHGLVRQVANFFTDLIGPIKNLQEATSAIPVNETAYQQAASNFLVSFPLYFNCKESAFQLLNSMTLSSCETGKM